MKNKQNTLVIISGLIIFLLCIIFLLNTNNVTNIIDKLNGTTFNNQNITKPEIANSLSDIKTVNTAELGKYKLNISNSPKNEYSCITPSNTLELSDFIRNTKGKILIVDSKNETDIRLYIAFIQFLAGGDYDNILDYYLRTFNDSGKQAARDYFNNYFSDICNINIKDVPYINLKKCTTNYLLQNGYSIDDVDNVVDILKENCD